MSKKTRIKKKHAYISTHIHKKKKLMRRPPPLVIAPSEIDWPPQSVFLERNPPCFCPTGKQEGGFPMDMGWCENTQCFAKKSLFEVQKRGTLDRHILLLKGIGSIHLFKKFSKISTKKIRLFWKFLKFILKKSDFLLIN